MKLLLKLSIFLFTFGLLVTSCEESDKFSSNPNLGLEFSRDTLRFDTVFTTLASPMQRMKVYNRNKNSISFESIELMNPEKSGFRINVDGLGGTKFEGVDLYRKDSIYITVDAKLHETIGKNLLVRDSICLKWNGNTKYIQLGAYGVNINIWDDMTISSNTQLPAEKGYYIRGALTINEGVTLQIEEGTTFYMDKKASIKINGTMEAKGTVKKPITFRGHRFDMIEKNIPYDNASDQWIGVTVGANSFNNILENVRIRNSQKGIDFLPSTPNQKKATLLNTVVHNTSHFGIRAANSNIDAVNCLFSNSKGALLEIAGGSYSFLHTTIANYYTWHSRTSSSVILENSKYPLTKCEFKNSIIVGSRRNETSIAVGEESSYVFNNCVIQASAPSDAPQFIGKTIWNIDTPFLFKDLNSQKRYFYNFELTDNSSARNAADATLATEAPFDLRGVPRSTDPKPDIGCYEWIR